jgi:SOUL heme-binding protein
MNLAALFSSIWLAGCSVFGIRETPEPPYTVLAKIGPVEIRQYGARTAAETTVSGDEVAARSAGFRRLAGYIFGGNHLHQSIAMTAPVAQQSTNRGQDIAMTAPVAHSPAMAGAWRIEFFMPAGYTLKTLPVPDNPAVKLVPVPPQTAALIRFRGTASPGAVARERHALLDRLDGSEWKPVGVPVTWFFDPPWALPPLRRNEIAVAVERR